jgi:hypothetical protein
MKWAHGVGGKTGGAGARQPAANSNNSLGNASIRCSPRQLAVAVVLVHALGGRTAATRARGSELCSFPCR